MQPISIKSSTLLLVLLAWLAFPLQGCQHSDSVTEAVALPVPKPEPRLVQAEKMGEFTPEQIGQRFGSLPQVELLVRYPVAVYRITYRTPAPDGSTVEASGALLVPKANSPLPLLSQQHGTIESDRSAPSHYASGTEVWSFGTVLSSVGYVVAAPDYLGYGASRGIPHPYQHAASLASASADMLRAAREFCKSNNVALNGQLFLAGYSEGGFATMALHKLLESRHAGEFTVTASAPGAGAYHTSAFARHVLGADKPLTFIDTYLWVLQTYNRVYALNRPLSYYLNEPYASRLQTNGRGLSNAVSPRKLFTAQFREAVEKQTDTAFMHALRDNDLHNWKPIAPIALFHGTDDDYVPFFNSENAYKAMQARGATQVELRPIQGGNHFSSVARYTVGMLLYFAGFQVDEEPEQAN